MLRTTLVLLSFFSFFGALSAQDLHVHYNVFRDSVYYVVNGKATDKPFIRKGNTVQLHVENYNNYLYDVSVAIEKEEIPVASTNAAGLLGQLGGGAMPLNFLFKGGDQMLGKFFSPLSGDALEEGSGFTKTEAEKERLEKVIILKQMEADFLSAKDKLFSLENAMKTMQEQVQQKLAAQRIQAFAVEEIDHIRFNPRLEPNQIKRMSAEYMERIFAEKDPNKIDLTQVLKIADAQTELPKAIYEYRKKADQYAASEVACEILMKGIQKFDFPYPESNLSEFRSEVESFVNVARNKTQSHQENAAMLEATIPDIQTLDPKHLSELRTTYIELNNNSFSKTYRHVAIGEKLSMKLKLSPIDSMESKGVKTIELTPVEVNIFGGMRIRASVGLNFGQFFSRPQTYFVRDSAIQSANKDAFVPVMTSFVHFYAPSPRSMSIAGSFGVGFPLGGGENLQSISFFLGPSLLFGKGERIVLNAGIMGGKKEALSNGYQVGDPFGPETLDAPTTTVYALGYYLGVSFNLAGGGMN